MPKKLFELTPQVCGNPDYGQDPNQPPYGVDIVKITAHNFDLLLKRVREWQYDNDIGGGNWMNPTVYVDGKEVGYMSYNGKVWANRSWTPNTKQINLTEENHE